jgi:hypothetical protein
MGKTKYITNPETVQTLQELTAQKGGLLKPLDVVEAARPETHPLHKHFEWDDSVAAERFRIEQARTLLQRVYVKMETPDGKGRMAQVFVSLTTDRDEGGYRTMVDVLSDADMRNQLIRDALGDMQSFTDRYKTLRDLAGVFSSMRKARKKLEKVA